MPRFLRLAPAMICFGSLAMLAGCAVKAVPGPPSATADLAETPTSDPKEVKADTAFGRSQLTIDFGDYQSAAELTYPASGEGPFPAVVLIPGSGPEDKDAHICAPGSTEPLSHIFKDIGEFLPQRGIAVLRYDKHYVTGPCQADEEKFSRLGLDADARRCQRRVGCRPVP